MIEHSSADMYQPWPNRINEHCDHVEKLTDGWMQDYAGTVELDKWRHRTTLTGHFAARMFPTTPRNRLIPMARFLLWGLVFDDTREHYSKQDIALERERIGGILRDGPAPDSANAVDWHLRMVRDEFAAFMTPAWLERFACAVETFVHGMELEAPYKAGMRWPTLAEYAVIRRQAVCVYPLVVFCEAALDHPLPDEVATDMWLRLLADLTARILSWTNDYFSVANESGKDVMNLILVIEREQGVSRDEAYVRAIRMHNEDVYDFLQVAAAVPDFGEFNDTVRTFVDTLGMFIRGQRTWYELDTPRYTHRS